MRANFKHAEFNHFLQFCRVVNAHDATQGTGKAGAVNVIYTHLVLMLLSWQLLRSF